MGSAAARAPAAQDDAIEFATDAGWTRDAAVALCREIEAVCPPFGCHVALTGGTLYKDGARKDCDILFYRIRQAPEIDTEGLFTALAAIGVEKVGGFGWCHKATFQGKNIDCFFPEEDGDYPVTAAETAVLDALVTDAIAEAHAAQARAAASHTAGDST